LIFNQLAHGLVELFAFNVFLWFPQHAVTVVIEFINDLYGLIFLFQTRYQDKPEVYKVFLTVLYANLNEEVDVKEVRADLKEVGRPTSLAIPLWFACLLYRRPKFICHYPAA